MKIVEKIIKTGSIIVLAGLIMFAYSMANRSKGLEQNGEPALKAEENTMENQNLERAVFAAGCFWGVEAAFKIVPGVKQTRVGYAGGDVNNPTYRQVCTDATGHAESVEIFFDPNEIGYDKLLKVFFVVHDPTQVNRQGPDVGSQYRSVIFYTTEHQKQQAIAAKDELAKSGKYSRPIATEIIPAGKFYSAEDYHQDYLDKNPRGYCHINMAEVREFIEKDIQAE